MKQVNLLKAGNLMLAILTATIFLLFACKKTECDAFPGQYLEYIPYTTGNTMKFTNENRDTLSMRINNNYLSDAYSFDWNCDCACSANAGFETEFDSRYSLAIKGDMLLDDLYSLNLSYSFQTNYDYSDDFSINKGKVSNLSDTIVIENQQFNRVGKVKIIREKGIVEFSDSKYNCIWVLSDK